MRASGRAGGRTSQPASGQKQERETAVELRMKQLSVGSEGVYKFLKMLLPPLRSLLPSTSHAPRPRSPVRTMTSPLAGRPAGRRRRRCCCCCSCSRVMSCYDLSSMLHETPTHLRSTPACLPACLLACPTSERPGCLHFSLLPAYGTSHLVLGQVKQVHIAEKNAFLLVLLPFRRLQIL